MKKEIPQSIKMYGVYRITKSKLVTPADFALSQLIANERDKGNDIGQLLTQLHAQCASQVVEVRNLIPTAGRTALASHLTSSSPSPSSLRANYGALGTNTTAPANTDTQLGTETYRNAVASATKSNNVAYITLFFSATEVTGTFKEVGLFLNGTASANSGTLFSHSAIDITKSGTETLTIDYTITIS